MSVKKLLLLSILVTSTTLLPCGRGGLHFTQKYKDEVLKPLQERNDYFFKLLADPTYPNIQEIRRLCQKDRQSLPKSLLDDEYDKPSYALFKGALKAYQKALNDPNAIQHGVDWYFSFAAFWELILPYRMHSESRYAYYNPRENDYDERPSFLDLLLAHKDTPGVQIIIDRTRALLKEREEEAEACAAMAKLLD